MFLEYDNRPPLIGPASETEPNPPLVSSDSSYDDVDIGRVHAHGHMSLHMKVALWSCISRETLAINTVCIVTVRRMQHGTPLIILRTAISLRKS